MIYQCLGLGLLSKGLYDVSQPAAFIIMGCMILIVGAIEEI